MSCTEGGTPDSDNNDGPGILDTKILRSLAELVELPPDVRDALGMAGVAIDSLVKGLREQDKATEILRKLFVSLIYEAGGAIYIPHKTLAECPSGIAIERTEPFDRDGCMYRINMDRWPDVVGEG